MKAFIYRFVEMFRDRNAGYIGAVAGFSLALFLVIFGILRTLFIIIMTLAGFYLGARLFSDKEKLKSFLDKIIPPGRFR
mgnify:CR=1 FL=1